MDATGTAPRLMDRLEALRPEPTADQDPDNRSGNAPAPPGGVGLDPDPANVMVAVSATASDDRHRLFTARRTTKTLVMWSGGLDSTYSLVRLLLDTDDEVYAHHVHCNVRRDDGLQRSRRCEYEAQAIVRMVPYLGEHYRRFDFSESRVDLTAFGQFARDTTTAMYFAAQAALTHGFTPFDRIVFGVNSDEDREWQPGTNAYALRRLLTIRMLKAVWECEEVPYLYLWHPRPSKRSQAQYLPAELVEMTASCRNPVASELRGIDPGFRSCGRCPQCRTLAGASGPGLSEHGNAQETPGDEAAAAR